MSTVLVTGVNGFAGKHLVRELHARGFSVFGVGHSAAHPSIEPLLDKYASCDLTNSEEVAKLDVASVDAVVSLASLTGARGTLEENKAYIEANIKMLTLLCERLLAQGSKARVIAVSTSQVYDPNQAMPLVEESSTVNEGSPYIMSKLALEQAASELRARGLDCIIARPFNHTGPEQTGGYLIPDVYRKLVEFKQNGTAVPVSPKVTKRDYSDVRDVVRAYADLIEASELRFDTYNICSGKSRSVADITKTMQEVLGLTEIATNIDQNLARPNDPEDLYGSYKRLHDETGWEPTIAFEQTIRDFISTEADG